MSASALRSSSASPAQPPPPRPRVPLRRAILPACAVLALGLAAPMARALSQQASAAARPGRRAGGPEASIAARHASEPLPATVAAPPAPYAPGVVVVDYAASAAPSARAAVAHIADAGGTPAPTAGAAEMRASEGGEPIAATSDTRLLRLRPGVDVPAAIARLQRLHQVVWAAPDYIAHASAVRASSASAAPFPDDPGSGGAPGDWRQLQWNFAGTFGVEAPRAWANLIADHAPGGRGVIVAVLDTGVAYANRGPFRRSPDFYGYQFVKGYDFVARNPYPNDRNGHGTDVAGTIAEATDNDVGVTGLAYGVRLMPVRVLDSEGNGDASVIAKGVRFAVNHGARVINLSLEFPVGVTASDIPELIDALRYAHRRRVVVVAAAGNEAHAAAALPARSPTVIAVGATTEHGCLASYSNYGTGLALVAPGGGPDATLPGDPNCHPDQPPGGDIYQMTFTGASPRRFGLPSGYEGTSMATPHVAATAALIIASRVLGRHPTPAQILARLRATARPLGGPGDGQLYGAGLLDAAAATAPGGPGA